MVWVGMACLAKQSSSRVGGSPFNGSLASLASALVALPLHHLAQVAGELRMSVFWGGEALPGIHSQHCWLDFSSHLFFNYKNYSTVCSL